MTAPHMSSEQFGPLYHGSGSWIPSGEGINPTTHPAGRSTAAWGTYDLSTAAKYAGGKAAAQGQLFSPVYEVEHPTGETIRYNRTVGSTKALRVKKIVGYGSYTGQLV